MKVGFFEEAEGEFSITRLIVFIVTIIAIVYGGMILYIGLKLAKNVGDLLTVGTSTMTVFGGIFTLAAGFKLFQRKMEGEDTKIIQSNTNANN